MIITNIVPALCAGIIHNDWEFYRSLSLVHVAYIILHLHEL